MWRSIGRWLLRGLTALSLLLFLNFLTNLLVQRNDEEVAFIALLLLLVGFYSGRYIAYLWVHLSTLIQNLILFFLVALVIFSIFIFGVLIMRFLSHPQEEVLIFFIAMVFFLIWICIGAFVKLIQHQINNKIKVAELNAANSKTELQLLQSQLSPHFLFNTLNNLYGISLTEHEKIPSLLLKLSELLRYSVYNTSDLYVPLQDEIDYLNNYIAFERIRLGPRLNLVYEIENSQDKSIKIAPMLLIVFVENAFKHAKNTHDKQIFINISLKIWGNALLFSVKNSHAKANPKTDLCDDTNGFGLLSVQKRLALLYKQAHDLKITEGEKEYLVMLRLDIK